MKDNCKDCSVKDFVFADLYCQGCKHKPRVAGVVSIYRKNKLHPADSIYIEAAEDEVFLAAAHELLQQYRLEFVPDEVKELSELIFNEM